jgi:hypothetical protein
LSAREPVGRVFGVILCVPTMLGAGLGTTAQNAGYLERATADDSAFEAVVLCCPLVVDQPIECSPPRSTRRAVALQGVV